MTVEQALLEKILYIGEELPESIANDPRPKFVVLGTPQEIIDSVSTATSPHPDDFYGLRKNASGEELEKQREVTE